MIRPVYVLPNLFTSASLFCALVSIIATSNGDYQRACYLILISACLDAMDGPVARWTRTASSFGLQYDSLADLVAFGVAPAFLMYTKLDSIDKVLASQSKELPGFAGEISIGLCALFAICGALRLARFNIQVSSEEKTHFTGLPIPAAAGTIVSTFLVVDTYLSETRNLHRIILILMMVVSYLMVSTYPFPSLKGIYRKSRRSMNSLVTLVFVICTVIAFRKFFPIVVWVGFMIYISVSLFNIIRHKHRTEPVGLPLSGDENDTRRVTLTR